MKIAIYHNLPSGGAKRAVFETLQRLAQRHIVDVYTLSTADHTFCDLRPVVRQHRTFEFRPSPLFQSPLGRLNQWQRRRDLKRLEGLARQIAAEIDRRGYDVVYVQPCMWTQAPTVTSFLQTPSVYHIHEPLRMAYEPAIPRTYGNGRWRTKIDKVDPFISLYRHTLIRLDRRNTRRATCLLANSRFTADNVARIYDRPARVSYFGVDTTAFCPLGHVKNENFVLSVGALRPNKGFDFLIKALAQMPARVRPPLGLVGNADDRQERAYLTDLAANMSVDLTIETMVDLKTLVQRYNQAALLVYTPVREPFGLVPLEAMACGTPVVGVAEGGVRETVVNGVTGRLVDRDPLKFAKAIQSLLKDPGLREQYGRQAREYVLKEWTWDRAVARIERHLYNTAGRSPNRTTSSPERVECLHPRQ